MKEESAEASQSRGGGDRRERTFGLGRRSWLILGVLAVTLLVASVLSIRALGPLRVDPPVRIADVSSERLLTSGSVVGFAADGDTHAWLGIPYARPPVGALRWRAPAEPEAWTDTRDALHFGPPCVQLASPLGGVPAEDDEGFAGSEDCLHLNVWAPRAEPDAVAETQDRHPVMVWIHGGGNRVGQGGGSMYDGARLAGSQNVVVVSFNYRLGPFGWFSHPALRAGAEDPLEASGNFGTLDQIRALEWVRTNIDEFGGDPDNVTIFGESAGGTNVLALLLAPPAAGLFHRAIAQSGSTLSFSRAEAEHPRRGDPPGHRHSSAEMVVSMVVGSGLVPDRDAARGYVRGLPRRDLADLLRARSAREVLDAARDPDDLTKIDLPRVIRDGVLLPEGDWLEAYREGRFHPVPVLLGSNRDEMKLFLSQRPDHVRRYFGVLYRIRNHEEYERLAREESNLWKRRAVDDPAAALADSGRTRVYAYRFDWDDEPRLLGTDFGFLLGAAHGFELPFLFGTFDVGNPGFNRVLFSERTRMSRERLAEQMQAYWTEFARTGRPGRGGREDLPEWPPWEPLEADSDGMSVMDATSNSNGISNPMMVLDTGADGGVRVVESPLPRTTRPRRTLSAERTSRAVELDPVWPAADDGGG
jgi:para-nitrobenzyl esterase